MLDEEIHDESRMITLKVDLNLPYLSQNTDFERVDGEINVDGHIYKYVKRKIHNGQLILLCMPDDVKTKLRSADKNYFVNVNNLAAHSETNSSSKHTVEKNASDYDRNNLEYHLTTTKHLINYDLPANQCLSISPITDFPEYPPEQI